MLSVLQDAPPPPGVGSANRKPRNRYVLCQCDCGRKTSVRVDHLRQHKTRSCGCQAADRLWLRAMKAVVTDNGLSWSSTVKQMHELDASAAGIAEQIARAAAEEQAREAAIPKPSEKERRFGLPAGAYEAMLLEQGGTCAICREPPSAKALAVDHDHNTGRVRGLLCHQCNTGLGHFRDDLNRLAGAMRYLVSGPVVK